MKSGKKRKGRTVPREIGCIKCCNKLEQLASAIEQEACVMYQRGDPWEKTWQIAMGIRLSEGLLRFGRDADGIIMANLPPPPDVDPEEYRNRDQVDGEVAIMKPNPAYVQKLKPRMPRRNSNQDTLDKILKKPKGE